MIYVIDNGQEYSDHVIQFVETDEPLEVMQAIVGTKPDEYIVLCAERHRDHEKYGDALVAVNAVSLSSPETPVNRRRDT